MGDMNVQCQHGDALAHCTICQIATLKIRVSELERQMLARNTPTYPQPPVERVHNFSGLPG